MPGTPLLIPDVIAQAALRQVADTAAYASTLGYRDRRPPPTPAQLRRLRAAHTGVTADAFHVGGTDMGDVYVTCPAPRCHWIVNEDELPGTAQQRATLGDIRAAVVAHLADPTDGATRGL